MPAPVALVLTDAPPPEARRAILDGLDAFNQRHGGDYKLRQLAVLIEEKRRVVGGLLGWTWWEWLYVEWLFVPEVMRRSGLGRDIMRRAESEARERGCRGVYLDTFHFQARGFYEKLGYTVYGRLDGMPAGGARYYLSKKLTP